MMRFLIFLIFLIGLASLAGLSGIIIFVDPTVVNPLIFPVFVFLVFLNVFVFLGLVTYLVRTKIASKHLEDKKHYVKQSFSGAFFVGLLAAIVATLGILRIINIFNLIASILAVVLFASWIYLGRRRNR